MIPLLQKNCELCGDLFEAKRSTQKYCKKAHMNTCVVCNKEFLIKKKTRPAKTCSSSCASSLSHSEESKETRKRNSLARYGVEHTTQVEEYKDKAQKTQRERNGGKLGFNTDKQKETMIAKYGADNPSKLDWVKARKIESYKKNFGVDNPMHSQVLKDKLWQKRIDNGDVYINDEDFISTLENWEATNGRKPTFSDLQEFWGYAHSASIGQRVVKLRKSHLINKKDSYLELKVKDFLDEFGINYKRRDKTQIKPKELDFWLPDHNVAIEVNDFLTHNSTFTPWGEPKSKDYHIKKTKLCRGKGIRLIHAWEDQILDDAKFKVLKNAILHACGKSLNKVYARNTRIEVRPAIEMKNFFNENNIAGYRGAKDVYVLVCKNTNEDLMAYSVGHARFGKGKYDAEIIRGASKLGYTVVGGASKLWKYIIDNTNYNSIVYYVDLNTYAGESMNFLKNVEFVSEQPGLKNFWVKERRLKNREPARHKEIVELTKQGEIWAIWDAGVQVNVWYRK